MCGPGYHRGAGAPAKGPTESPDLAASVRGSPTRALAATSLSCLRLSFGSVPGGKCQRGQPEGGIMIVAAGAVAAPRVIAILADEPWRLGVRSLKGK